MAEKEEKWIDGQIVNLKKLYCHAFSDRRRVLDWQLDLLQSYTQVQYNLVSPDSLSLTTHDSLYHDNSAATVSTATALLASIANTILVAAELQVPFLFPWIPTQLTHSTGLTTENSEVYGLWTDCREDNAFGIGCLAIT
jgi:hypothetical protein